MKTIIQKMTWLLCIALTVTSCSKENDKDPEGTDECWYKITIDGQVMLPNQFGQDRISITGGIDEENGEAGLAFSISQAKGTSNRESILVTLVRGLLNRTSSTGTYPVYGFTARPLTSSFERYPIYVFGDENPDHDGAYMTFNLLENSDQRIRLKVSGTTVRIEDAGETGIVPLEAEIIIGRKYIHEVPLSGAYISGGNCDCPG